MAGVAPSQQTVAWLLSLSGLREYSPTLRMMTELVVVGIALEERWANDVDIHYLEAHHGEVWGA